MCDAFFKVPGQQIQESADVQGENRVYPDVQGMFLLSRQVDLCGCPYFTLPTPGGG